MPDELFVGDTVVELGRGDVTTWRCDAIVNAANTDLVLGAGVAGAIDRRAGATVQREALEKAPIALGAVARTRAGLLPAKFVIHAGVTAGDAKTDGDIIGRATAAALKDAESIGLKSVAFPALGTGVGGLPYRVAADAMFAAVVKYLTARTVVRLRKITFVLFDDEAYNEYRGAMDRHRAAA